MDGIIRAGLDEMGLADRADPGAPALLDRYGQLLLQKNQVMNLTAITEPEQAARLHMLDCAALLNCAGFAGKTLIDVGTGAGFPGMVLKILCPSLEVTLLDSLGKRLDWLEEVCGELGLRGVRTIHARAEEKGHDPDFRERFDFAASRAVAALPVLAELCLPLVRVGGQFLSMKSLDSDQELRQAEHAVELLGGTVESVRDYDIPGTDVRHRLILIKKIRETKKKYPRTFAKIKRNPLY